MGGRLAGVALLLALTLAAVGCVTSRTEGVMHTVAAGETVWRIAAHYGVPVSEVIEANGIRDVRDVPVGTRLWIPHARPGRPSAVPLRPPQLPRGGPAAGEDEAGRPITLRFEWPVRGRLSSMFGPRGRRRHEGLDIAAAPGTLVRAAEAGRVIFVGRLGSYGNVVVLRHDRHYETVYAHNRRNRVRRGAFVDKGAVLAEVGATGNATGPHLHFEVRRDDRPQDPLLYLP